MHGWVVPPQEILKRVLIEGGVHLSQIVVQRAGVLDRWRVDRVQVVVISPADGPVATQEIEISRQKVEGVPLPEVIVSELIFEVPREAPIDAHPLLRGGIQALSLCKLLEDPRLYKGAPASHKTIYVAASEPLLTFEVG